MTLINIYFLVSWPVRYLWSDLTWWHSEYQLADGCWPLSRPHRRILWPRHWRPQSHPGLQMRARRPPGVVMLTPREHSKSYPPWSSLNWMMMNLLAWCWLLWGTWSTHGKTTCSDNPGIWEEIRVTSRVLSIHYILLYFQLERCWSTTKKCCSVFFSSGERW